MLHNDVYLIQCCTDDEEPKTWYVHTRLAPNFSHIEGVNKLEKLKKLVPQYSFRLVRYVPNEIVYPKGQS